MVIPIFPANRPRGAGDAIFGINGVHGVGGVLGTLLAGVFATAALSAGPDAPNGIAGLIEGNPMQLVWQALGVGVTLLWSGLATYLLLKLVGALVELRVKPESELIGLDITLHGEAVQ
ncbi:MAG: ammonium transporter [Sphingopyxis terrae]|nr:MAG: ammonium transporter [Sphingopyxis terrae]